MVDPKNVGGTTCPEDMRESIAMEKLFNLHVARGEKKTENTIELNETGQSDYDGK